MLRARLEFEKVDHVNEPDLDIGELLAQQSRRGQSLLRGDVAGRRENYVGFAALIVACPVPDPDALRTVLDCRFHIEVLEVELFIRDDNINVVLASEAMVRD